MDKLVQRAQKIAKDNHLRWTKQRELMVELLIQQPDRYLNIVEIDQALRKEFPGLSHDTVYRNFKEFEKLGIVETHLHNDQMQVKYSCDSAHHHHFICDQCGRVQEIQMPPLDQHFFEQQLPGAKITGHSFELHGICAQCQAKNLK